MKPSDYPYAEQYGHIYMREVPLPEHPNFHTPRPEWGGKSLADFWDPERECMADDCPKEIMGITHFLKHTIERNP